MIAGLVNIVAVAAPALGQVFLQSNAQDEGGGGWLLLAGPAAGVGVAPSLDELLASAAMVNKIYAGCSVASGSEKEQCP